MNASLNRSKAMLLSTEVGRASAKYGRNNPTVSFLRPSVELTKCHS